MNSAYRYIDWSCFFQKWFVSAFYIFLLLVFFIFLSGSLWSQDLESFDKENPFKVSGNIEGGLNFYETSDTIKSMEPVQWTVGSALNFNIYGFNLPISVQLSSQNKKLKLPFNRIGLSPHYKWAKVHLGWRSLNFNNYTLGGQQMNGVGFELTPGKLQLAYMYGKINNAVTDISDFNNLNDNDPIYKRTAHAFKLGYGSERNFLTFSMLQGDDDINSAPDAIKSQTRQPAASNLAGGVNMQISLFGEYVKIKFEGAGSLYTNDITADSTKLPALANKIVNGVFIFKNGFAPPVNISSKFSKALNPSVDINTKNFSLSFDYLRIDPDYRSMGTFYMQDDLEQYTVSPSFNFWQNKIILAGSLGYQFNNLYEQNTSSSKRTIGMGSLSVNPSQNFGINMQYSNYGISQQVLTQYKDPSSLDLTFYDSVRISQVSQSFSVSPNVMFFTEKQAHVFSVNVSLQNLQDNNNINQGQGDYSSSTANLNHNWQFKEIDISINQNAMFINTKTAINSIGSMGYTLGLSKGLTFKNEKERPLKEGKKERPEKNRDLRVTFNLAGNYFANLLDSKKNGSTTGVNGGVSLYYGDGHSLNWTIGTILNNNEFAGIKNKRNDFVSAIRYGYRF